MLRPYRRRQLGLIVLSFMLSLLLGCTYKTLRTPEQLNTIASERHGACTTVSENSKDSYSEIYVEDEAQHFTYKVYCTHTRFIDGPLNTYSVYDNFDECFAAFVVQETANTFDLISEKYGVTYDTSSRSTGPTIIVYSENEISALEAGEEMKQQLENYRYENRLKDARIYLVHNDGNYGCAKDKFGTIWIESGEYESTEAELIDYYSYEAKHRLGVVEFMEVEYCIPIAEANVEWAKIQGGINWVNRYYSIGEGEYCDRYTFRAIPTGVEYYLYSFKYISEDHADYYLVKK